MQYNILYSCISHIGNVRSINQDNFICDGRYMESSNMNMRFPLHGNKSSKEASVFGIFDGMGGEERGEIASYIAAKDASNLEIKKDKAVDLLGQFCLKANSDICAYANENEISSMGTTAALLVFTKNGVTLCNIGDSKIFRYDNGVLEQISKDHIAIAAFGVKPPLSQNLGIPPSELKIEPYFAQGVYNDEDIYLICSDGLTDMVTNEEIANVLKTKEIKDATSQLLEKALINGGRDNITLILCKIKRKFNWLSHRKNHTKERSLNYDA